MLTTGSAASDGVWRRLVRGHHRCPLATCDFVRRHVERRRDVDRVENLVLLMPGFGGRRSRDEVSGRQQHELHLGDRFESSAAGRSLRAGAQQKD